MPKRIRVLIVDDHAVVRAGLRLLLDEQEDIQVVAEAGTAREAVVEARASKPDVILMDVVMPGQSGIDVIPQLLHEEPDTKILVLSMHDDPGYVRRALAEGGAGYVLKEAVDEEVVAAVYEVAAGRRYVNAALGARLVKAEAEERARAESDLLSDREHAVLRLLAFGHTNQEIASLLHISVRTAETHRAHIMQKLRLTTRADLVRFAREAGVLRADQSLTADEARAVRETRPAAAANAGGETMTTSVASSSPQTLAKLGVALTPVSLELPPSLHFNAWRRIGEQLEAVFNANLWWRADWAAHGERAYRKDYGPALEAMYKRASIHNLASVARRVELSRRRENLSFGHHEAVASLEPRWQTAWLDDALAHGWTRDELRDRIATWKGHRRATSFKRLTIRAVGELYELCTRAAARAGREPADWAADVLERAARKQLADD